MSKRTPYSTRYFVWLHTPKTGGTWLWRILTTLAPKEWEAHFRDPAHVMLHEAAPMLTRDGLQQRVSLPRIAHVRNPWDWYVSLYFFMEQHYRNRTGGFSVPERQWSAGCKAWHKSLSRGNHAHGFRDALPLLLHRLHSEGDGSVSTPQHTFLRPPDGVGYPWAVRFESLRDSFLSQVERSGASVPKAMREQILSRAPENTSGHAGYRSLYTMALRDLVAEYEEWLIGRFGYEF